MLRVGLAQINPTVGDLPGNRQRILEAYRELVGRGAELVVFPELAVCGYPPRDLLLKRRFPSDVEDSLHQIAAEIGPVPALVGYPETRPDTRGRPLWNAAAVCHQGEIVLSARKRLLPTYDVFDEDRYFEPADESAIFVHHGLRIGITICEDIWTGEAGLDRKRHRADPAAELRTKGVDLVVNLSASPWHCGKESAREAIVAVSARTAGAPVVYCNAVGGNDELIFDGRSIVLSAEGKQLAGLAAFREELAVVDLASTTPQIDPLHRGEEMAELRDALVLGLRDYAVKSGFRRALLGLSGGIDSAVVAALAAEALGAENVIGVSLPSAISSQHSRDDARELAKNLGIDFHTIGIAEVVEAAEHALAPIFGDRPRDVAEENLQARARGLLLMGISNKFGALLLTTGNKSEVSVGYCTLYGDMAGGLAVISDVFKTKVYELARFLNREREVIPLSTIEKPPSAELRPGQVDQDSLPPYDALDAILQGYVEQGLSSRDLIAKGFDETVVKDIVRKVDLNEYKRKQAAPGLKITPLAFGVGRRIPIVQRYVG
jgi:NAD+ synthase (glutamine-hydrolysing)